MNKSSFLVFILSLGAWLAGPAARAQSNCPMQTTEHRDERLLNGPANGCKGIDLRVGSLTVSTAGTNCPAFVTYTPEHEIAIAAKTLTMVEILSTHAVMTYTFQCHQDWFLFIPIGTSCVWTSVQNVNAVHRMIARPCAIAE